MKFQYDVADINGILKSKMYDKCREEYNRYKMVTTNMYVQIQPILPKTAWYKGIILPRKFITIISRLRFGHASFPMHLHKIGVLQTSICVNCNVLGDLDHIFFNCSKYLILSNELIKNLIKLDVSCPLNIAHLLSLHNIEVFKEVINYLNKANICL